jgi:hypothetical protein
MTKKQCDYLLRKIYAALKDETVRFKLDRKLGKVYGELACPDGNKVIIKVNPAKKGARGGFMSTVIHECLHMISAACERDIEVCEEEMFKVITDRQLENLLKRISTKIS